MDMYIDYDDFMVKAEDWLIGFMEYSPLFEYEVTDEEKKREIKSFRQHMQRHLDDQIMIDGVGQLTYPDAEC